MDRWRFVSLDFHLGFLWRAEPISRCDISVSPNSDFCDVSLVFVVPCYLVPDAKDDSKVDVRIIVIETGHGFNVEVSCLQPQPDMPS